MKVVTLVRMIVVEFSSNGSPFPVLMNDGVLFFEVMYDPFPYEMRGDVVRNNQEFRRVSNGMNDAMSNGSGDSSGENNVEAEDISVLVSEFVF